VFGSCFGSCGRDGKPRMTKMVRHVECKDKIDWVSAYRELQVDGTKSKRRGRKTKNQCVKFDMKGLDWSRMMLIIELSGGVSQLETVEQCRNAVMRV